MPNENRLHRSWKHGCRDRRQSGARSTRGGGLEPIRRQGPRFGRGRRSAWRRAPKRRRPIATSSSPCSPTMPRSRMCWRGRDGLLEGLRPGALHISMSTISVRTAEHVAALHHWPRAALSQRPGVRSTGRRGGRQALHRGRRYRRQTSRRQIRCSARSASASSTSAKRPSAANLVKLCGNFMILCGDRDHGRGA